MSVAIEKKLSVTKPGVKGNASVKKRTETSKAGSASAKKRTATAKAGSASAKKRTATSKAGSALPKKRTATAKAGSASTKKRTATSKAGSASAKKRTATAKAGSASTKKRTATAKRRSASAKRPSASQSRAKSARTGASSAQKSARKSTVQVNPVANARHRRPSAEAESTPSRKRSAKEAGANDLFLEKRAAARRRSGGEPPKRSNPLFGALNVCLLIGIGVFIALGMRQQSAYADFIQMRNVVDQQTFYEGTTVEGVDVSRMTLADAMAYWGERVEPRYAERTVTLDDGAVVTSGQLGYSSDYAAVLSAAWSAGRNGTLEERYRMASGRRENPVAYGVTRSDYDRAALEQYVRTLAEQIDRPAMEADIEGFDAQTYEFRFSEARPGKKLDTEALKRDIATAIAAGGGSASLQIETLQPTTSTTEVMSRYGLIDYAITNASSSSRARLNNIKLAMSMLNGTRVAPGEEFSFNRAVGQRTVERGFRKATAYSGGDVTEQVGGGICQVSTTLFNAAVKADMEILERHNHSLTVSYVDKGKDATVSWDSQDFRFKNTSDDDIYICCYLTEDKRVRFGIFGKLLPNGETITLDAVTTETTKFETQYQPSPLLAPGETYVLEPGRNGYKAEAYKVRRDAQGNELSRELLCRSFYKVKDEIIQYGV